jgi:hypothetical protein
MASQMWLTVDLDTLADSPGASSRAASHVPGGQAPDVAGDDQGLNRVRPGHPGPQEAGGEGRGGAPQLGAGQGHRFEVVLMVSSP